MCAGGGGVEGKYRRNKVRHGLISVVLGTCRFILLLSLLLYIFENFHNKVFKSEKKISMLNIENVIRKTKSNNIDGMWIKH